jgi:hypothetical protein
VAAVSRAVVRQTREHVMKTKTNNPTVPVVNGPRRSPVRVKLRRVNADLAKSYPPDGQTKQWWDKLKRALGTTSSAFVNLSLVQLQAAARLPCSGISEIAVNAALAMIEAAAPRDECQSAFNRDPGSASKRDPPFLRFERLALAPSELVGVAETGRARVVV